MPGSQEGMDAERLHRWLPFGLGMLGTVVLWASMFLCFHTGPHKCVGYKLALLEAVLAVAALCHKYKFLLAHDDSSPALKMGVTLVPKRGVGLRVVSRPHLSKMSH